MRRCNLRAVIGLSAPALLGLVLSISMMGCSPPPQPGDGPDGDEPGTEASDTEEPDGDEPSADEPSTDEPSTDEPSTDEPSTDEPSTDEPSTDEPSTDEPANGGGAEETPAVDPAELSDLPADAPVSKYAPVALLEAQVPEYLEEIGESLEEPAEFESELEQLDQNANTMVVIALALGLHDQDNQYKAHAPAMLAAAQKVAAAENHADAQTAFEQLQKATEEGGDGPELKWEEVVASLPALMKEVPNVNSKITRNIKRRFDSRGDDIAAAAVTIAVIAQGSLPNTEETIHPEKVEEWRKYSLEMRNAAAQLVAAVQAKDEEAANKANDALQQTCHDCHAIFHPEEVQ